MATAAFTGGVSGVEVCLFSFVLSGGTNKDSESDLDEQACQVLTPVEIFKYPLYSYNVLF